MAGDTAGLTQQQYNSIVAGPYKNNIVLVSIEDGDVPVTSTPAAGLMLQSGIGFGTF
jgi:hypothetical protein